MEQAKKIGLVIHVETPYVQGKTEQSLGYDKTFMCAGYTFPGPKKFMQNELAKCLDPKSG